jgi:hypothetical protein
MFSKSSYSTIGVADPLISERPELIPALRKEAMEIQDIPVADVSESAPMGGPGGPSLEDQEFDRIAFELWQRGSLPDLAAGDESELEEVAYHASCL